MTYADWVMNVINSYIMPTIGLLAISAFAISCVIAVVWISKEFVSYVKTKD